MSAAATETTDTNTERGSWGVATVTFTRVDPRTRKSIYHDVKVPLHVPVEPGEDTSELAWEAAALWLESGWYSDDSDDSMTWWCSQITVKMSGV